MSITSPAANTTFTAPANITLTANAQDSDGTVTQVQYFANASPLGTATSSPYSFIWMNVAAGAYSLTARATDNAGASTTSAPVAITVGAVQAKLYFIHTDHLNTPRLISDDQQRTVWRWDNTDPFGGNPPDENPSGLGVFEFPLRFPGQYADRETNLHYNMARDYWTDGGRYIQSDPIGLAAGLNLYAYVDGNPLSFSDLLGFAPSFGQCLGSCVTGQFGLTAIGIGAVASGVPISALKPTGALGSAPGTSLASAVLSRAIPARLPFSIRTPTLSNPAARTAVLGRALGRYVPVVGVGILAYDATTIALCVNDCLNADQCSALPTTSASQ